MKISETIKKIGIVLAWVATIVTAVFIVRNASTLFRVAGFTAIAGWMLWLAGSYINSHKIVVPTTPSTDKWFSMNNIHRAIVSFAGMIGLLLIGSLIGLHGIGLLTLVTGFILLVSMVIEDEWDEKAGGIFSVKTLIAELVGIVAGILFALIIL